MAWRDCQKLEHSKGPFNPDIATGREDRVLRDSRNEGRGTPELSTKRKNRFVSGREESVG
jgi:hypothetical protein